ncbi:hypothetical protein Tco_0031330 [Tanacetum coccineum]
MECRYPSSRIVTVISHPDSGSQCRMLWVLTLRHEYDISYPETDRQSKEPSKHSKTCVGEAYVIDFWKRMGKTLYIGRFSTITVTDAINKVAYTLELPEELSSVHSTFYISNIKRCLSDESLVILMKELRLDDKLNFMEEPVEIIDREVKQLRQSRIPIVKIRWNSKRGP